MAIFTKGVPEMKAEKVTYDNTTSEFVADDVQSAIDEIDTSVDNLNAMQAVVKEYTLSATGWDTNNTYTITDSLITAGTNSSTQIIGYPSEKYSDEMYEVLAAANIRVASVSTGEIRLKAMGNVPSINLPITITYRVGADPVTLSLDSVPTSGSNNPITSDGVYQTLNNRYFWEDAAELGLDTTTYSKLQINYNDAIKLVTLRFIGHVAKALTSQTTYTICTIPQEIIDLIGHHSVTDAVYANTTVVSVTFNTWNSNVITITPRAAVNNGTYITGVITFQNS